MPPLPLSTIHTTNALIKIYLPPRLSAIFFGATSGIGESALYEFCGSVAAPLAVVVGRDPQAGERIAGECRRRNAAAEVVWVGCGDLAVMGVVDEVCERVRAVVRERLGGEGRVNLLWLSAGSVGFGKELTSEGLELHAALGMYSRIRTITNLLPLLQPPPTTSAPAPAHLSRIITYYAGNKGSSIDASDLSGARKSSMVYRMMTGTMLNLALEHLAETSPHTSILHVYPGMVRTNSQDTLPWGFRHLVLGIMAVGGSRWSPVKLPVVGVRESGERALCYAVWAGFPPRAGGWEGVAEGDVEPAIGSEGKKGGGFYMLNWDGRTETSKAVDEARADGRKELVWRFFVETFERIESAKGGSPAAELGDK